MVEAHDPHDGERADDDGDDEGSIAGDVLAGDIAPSEIEAHEECEEEREGNDDGIEHHDDRRTFAPARGARHLVILLFLALCQRYPVQPSS